MSIYEPQTVTRQHHNLVANANIYKQILRERPKTRHCNQEQTSCLLIDMSILTGKNTSDKVTERP